MWKVKFVALATAFVLIAGITKDADADRRAYVWTYEYQTMPKNHAEIEYYLTEEQKNIDKAKPNIWKHWLELEYGITDHWDISMYQQFKQSNTTSSSTFEYDGFKVRTRYRILKKGKLPIDTLLYLEYIRNDNLEKPNALEGKIIFAKDIDKFNISYNMIFEYQPKNNWRYVHKYALGLSYEVLDNLRIAFEAAGSYSEKKHYLGPTLSLLQPEFRINFGPQWGQNDNSNFLNVKLILGFPFK